MSYYHDCRVIIHAVIEWFLHLTPHNNNYPISIFNLFRVVHWPPSEDTTIWSISKCALFEIWQVCSILLESWSYHSIGYPLFVGHAHKPINPLTRTILNFWVQWLGFSLSNTIHQKPWKQSECCNYALGWTNQFPASCKRYVWIQ
jgi:hypothetical protein